MCRNKAGSTEYGVFRQILSDPRVWQNIFVFLKEIWEPRGYEVALPRLLKFLFAAGDHEAACPAAMQEPAWIPEGAESGDFGQTLQPPSDMPGCVQVRACDWFCIITVRSQKHFIPFTL